jgi:hypothetical protein
VEAVVSREVIQVAVAEKFLGGCDAVHKGFRLVRLTQAVGSAVEHESRHLVSQSYLEGRKIGFVVFGMEDPAEAEEARVFVVLIAHER